MATLTDYLHPVRGNVHPANAAVTINAATRLYAADGVDWAVSADHSTTRGYIARDGALWTTPTDHDHDFADGVCQYPTCDEPTA